MDITTSGSGYVYYSPKSYKDIAELSFSRTSESTECFFPFPCVGSFTSHDVDTGKKETTALSYDVHVVRCITNALAGTSTYVTRLSRTEYSAAIHMVN